MEMTYKCNEWHMKILFKTVSPLVFYSFEFKAKTSLLLENFEFSIIPRLSDKMGKA